MLPSTVTTASAVAPAPASPPASEPASVEPVPAESTETAVPVTEPTIEHEPYIVSCQVGLGPIITTWSDGTETGYSDYCQAQHGQVLQDEVEANTPVCDGTTCRYPSGATIPDPNAPAPDVTTPDDPLAELPADCRTSGCIQTYHGCEIGTITGEVCGRLGF